MHTIDAFEDAKHRAVQIRGQLYAYDRIDPARTALIVVDMQNVFVAPGQLVEVPMARNIVPDINRLADACRAAGSPVIWLQHTFDKDAAQGWPIWVDFGMTNGRTEEFAANMTPGTEGHAIYPELEVSDRDLKVHKRRYSAFVQGASALDAVLRRAGIDTIVIAGTLTNVCCESTARDAFFLNYRIIFGSDITACMSDEEQNATLLSMHSFFADVRSSEDVRHALQNNEHKFPT